MLLDVSASSSLALVSRRDFLFSANDPVSAGEASRQRSYPAPVVRAAPLSKTLPSPLTPAEQVLIDAIVAAMPILAAHRDCLSSGCASGCASGCVPGNETESLISYIAEHDHAIRLCENALQKAGMRLEEPQCL